MKFTPLILLLSALLVCLPAEARKKKFDIDARRNVVMKRSGGPGVKIVEVTARGGSVDKAIDRALTDAVAALTFDGAPGGNEVAACPPVLAGGRAAYEEQKAWFDAFFEDDGCLRFVRRASDGYPTGTDNVKVGRERQVRLTLIVNWQGLAELMHTRGLKTTIGNLQDL